MNCCFAAQKMVRIRDDVLTFAFFGKRIIIDTVLVGASTSDSSASRQDYIGNLSRITEGLRADVETLDTLAHTLSVGIR